MRTVSRITVAMSVIVMSLTSVGHTCAETNNLIRSMLSPLLVCTRLQGDRIVSRPQAVALQSDFFAGDDQWTEAEKREAFDWYLWHLTATAMPVRDGIMQSGNGRNPNPRVWNKHESTRVCKCNCRKHKCMGELPRVF